MLRLKSRASCQCFTNNTTSCAKNVTIAQPRNAPPRPNRTKAYKDKGPDDNTVVQTFVPNANSVQNNYYQHKMSNRTLLNEITDAISILTVPLCPAGSREITNLVEPRCIPCFCNDLALAQNVVELNRPDHWRMLHWRSIFSST